MLKYIFLLISITVVIKYVYWSLSAVCYYLAFDDVLVERAGDVLGEVAEDDDRILEVGTIMKDIIQIQKIILFQATNSRHQHLT